MPFSILSPGARLILSTHMFTPPSPPAKCSKLALTFFNEKRKQRCGLLQRRGWASEIARCYLQAPKWQLWVAPYIAFHHTFQLAGGPFRYNRHRWQWGKQCLFISLFFWWKMHCHCNLLQKTRKQEKTHLWFPFSYCKGIWNLPCSCHFNEISNIKPQVGVLDETKNLVA